MPDLKKTRLTVTVSPLFGTVIRIAWRKPMEFQDRQSERSTNDSVTVAKPRKHLTTAEMEKLIAAASGNRHAHRDRTALLLAYRHGLRSSELVALRWADIDLATGQIYVRRSKGGLPTMHPIGAKELRALRKLRRDTQGSIYLFLNERGSPWDVAGYQRMVARTARKAKFPFAVSSHALRHSCGFKLASDGQDTRAISHYLGHKSLASTAIYTALAHDRFKQFWSD
jgi:type 1 fimbriae regulatory protein FimB/type 1 fimbriae regulatory protein FimE